MVHTNQKKSIVQLTKDGQVVKVHASIFEACNELKIDRRNVQACIRGEREYAGGYQWQLASKVGKEVYND